MLVRSSGRVNASTERLMNDIVVNAVSYSAGDRRGVGDATELEVDRAVNKMA